MKRRKLLKSFLFAAATVSCMNAVSSIALPQIKRKGYDTIFRVVEIEIEPKTNPNAEIRYRLVDDSDETYSFEHLVYYNYSDEFGFISHGIKSNCRKEMSFSLLREKIDDLHLGGLVGVDQDENNLKMVILK